MGPVTCIYLLDYCAMSRLLSHIKGITQHYEETDFVFTILIVIRNNLSSCYIHKLVNTMN